MKHLALITILLALAGCAPRAEASGGFTVTAAFYPVYLAAANIADGAENMSLTLLTRPTSGCLHDYQLTPGELKAAGAADLVLASGMENFLNRIKTPVFNCGEGKDEHFWILPENFMEMADAIRETLSAADPANAELYQNNYDKYAASLSVLAEEMRETMGELNMRPVITFHEAFGLWAGEYGLNIAASIHREPGTEPTPRELAGIIDIVRMMDAAALFAEPQYPDTSARAISRETGCEVFMLDPIASGPMDLDYYQIAQRANLETLRLALGGTEN